MKTTHSQILTLKDLLEHWQGHRALTRKVIEVFPEKELFEFSIGGMRSFAHITQELLGIAAPGLREIVTGETNTLQEHDATIQSKSHLLDRWDKSTLEINSLWDSMTLERFPETVKTFGQYEGTVWSSIFYFIDNEIHHRGQGYVYLRALNIEPPYFWVRE